MQNYTEIPSATSMQASLALLLNNDKSALSLNSGSAFPTTNLQVGMPCLRVDQMKLYVLKDPAAPTWVCIADLNGVAWNSANQGTGSGMDADTVDGIHAAAVATANKLLALDANAKLPASITGDAATVGGRSSGNGTGQVPVSNGTLNTNLNSDMLGGKRAGNAANDIPLSNGILNTSLNADKLDGLDAADFARVIAGKVTLGATWGVIETAGVLYFVCAGVPLAKVDATGNLTVAGDITAFGDI